MGIIVALAVVVALFALVKGLFKMAFGMIMMTAAIALAWWAMAGFPLP